MAMGNECRSKPGVETPPRPDATPRFGDPQVEARLSGLPDPVAGALRGLRSLILETADGLPETGGLVETLKWGQPAYLPKRARVGTTLRIDAVKGEADAYALFFHCQSRLGATYREIYGDTLTIVGDRSIVLDATTPAPTEALRHCIALALTYHLRGRTDG